VAANKTIARKSASWAVYRGLQILYRGASEDECEHWCRDNQISGVMVQPLVPMSMDRSINVYRLDDKRIKERRQKGLL
jgi:hypothetical protein